MRAKEFIIEAISLDKIRAAGSPETPANRDLSARLKQGMSSKPRNFVSKNAKMGGAGAHKDKKKAEKQGDFKHKKQGMAEGSKMARADKSAKTPKPKDQQEYDDVEKYRKDLAQSYNKEPNFGIKDDEEENKWWIDYDLDEGVAEAKSASRRWHDALQREKERRERNERAGQELLNPKKKEEPKEKDVKEVAPPTAKGERMVKHIKKGYADDGKLTDKERSIAYATAWKAHNKS